MLSHCIRPVSEILAPHVEHLWVVRGYLPARWRNMILPDGAMELIVNLGDPQKLFNVSLVLVPLPGVMNILLHW
jgi:hypothetical protein